MILNRPSLSVSTVRTRSIRTGLAASTETPGRTGPVASFTTPAMALCAEATLGSITTTAATIATAADKLLPFMAGDLPHGGTKSLDQIGTRCSFARDRSAKAHGEGRNILE